MPGRLRFSPLGSNDDYRKPSKTRLNSLIANGQRHAIFECGVLQRLQLSMRIGAEQVQVKAIRTQAVQSTGDMVVTAELDLAHPEGGFPEVQSEQLAKGGNHLWALHVNAATGMTQVEQCTKVRRDVRPQRRHHVRGTMPNEHEFMRPGSHDQAERANRSVTRGCWKWKEIGGGKGLAQRLAKALGTTHPGGDKGDLCERFSSHAHLHPSIAGRALLRRDIRKGTAKG